MLLILTLFSFNCSALIIIGSNYPREHERGLAKQPPYSWQECETGPFFLINGPENACSFRMQDVVALLLMGD